MSTENKIASFLFKSSGVPSYGRFLDLSSLRHKLVSSNVANVSTPGYQNQDIRFEEELARSSGQTTRLSGVITHPAHLKLGEHPDRIPKIEREKVAAEDLNSVDIDREVPKMVQNELEFTVAAKLLQRKFEGLRKAITSK